MQSCRQDQYGGFFSASSPTDHSWDWNPSSWSLQLPRQFQGQDHSFSHPGLDINVTPLSANNANEMA